MVHRNILTLITLLLVITMAGKVNAEVVKIAVLSPQAFHASMKQWKGTADYLTESIPGYVFQVLPYSSRADLETDMHKNKLDFLLATNKELSYFAYEYSLVPILNTRSSKQDSSWTLAHTRQLSNQLTYSISKMLLKLPARHKLLKQSAIAGWQISSNAHVAINSEQKWKQVYNTMVELAATAFKQYWSLVAAGLLSCLLIVLYRIWDRYHTQQQVKKHREQANDPSLSDTVF